MQKYHRFEYAAKAVIYSLKYRNIRREAGSGEVEPVEKPVGTAVKKGDVILVVESMKMETPVVSPIDGTVAQIAVTQGVQVAAEQLLAVVK